MKLDQKAFSLVWKANQICGLFQVQNCKTIHDKAPVKRNNGCYKNSDQGERREGLYFPERDQREGGGICQVAPEGTHRGSNPIVFDLDIPGSPCRADHENAKRNNKHLNALLWPGSELHPIARSAWRQMRGS